MRLLMLLMLLSTVDAIDVVDVVDAVECCTNACFVVSIASTVTSKQTADTTEYPNIDSTTNINYSVFRDSEIP
jgi:hypothetical protein